MSNEVEGTTSSREKKACYGVYAVLLTLLAFFLVLGVCGLVGLHQTKKERAAERAAFLAEMSKTPVVASVQAIEIAASLMPACFLEGVSGRIVEPKTWLSAASINRLQVTGDRRIWASGKGVGMSVPIPVEAPTVRLLEEVAVALTARVEACHLLHSGKTSEQPAVPTPVPQD